MPVLVRIPTPLRALTKGSAEIQGKGETVDSLIGDLERQYPGLKDRLLDEAGELRRFINIYVNQEDIRFLQAKKTALKDGDEVSIVPAIARLAPVGAHDGPHACPPDLPAGPHPGADRVSAREGLRHRDQHPPGRREG